MVYDGTKRVYDDEDEAWVIHAANNMEKVLHLQVGRYCFLSFFSRHEMGEVSMYKSQIFCYCGPDDSSLVQVIVHNKLFKPAVRLLSV